MCGRFAQTNIIKSTSDIVKTVIGKVENKDNFNISPGQEAAVIKKYSNGRALELGHWGIFPSWAKDKEGNNIQKPTGTHPDCIDAARYALMMQLENPNRGKYTIQ